jgi:hypothetical protein
VLEETEVCLQCHFYMILCAFEAAVRAPWNACSAYLPSTCATIPGKWEVGMQYTWRRCGLVLGRLFCLSLPLLGLDALYSVAGAGACSTCLLLPSLSFCSVLSHVLGVLHSGFYAFCLVNKTVLGSFSWVYHVPSMELLPSSV